MIGPAFSDTTYQCYLYTLDKSGLVLSLASNKTDFVALMPTNRQYADNEPQMRLNTTTAGRLLEVYSDVDANFVTMGQGQARAIVNIHTAPNIGSLEKNGTQVVETNEAFNYWFVHDGTITTSARFNEQLTPGYTGSPFVPFHELTMGGQDWSNGKAYGYDATGLFTATTGDGMVHRLALGNDVNYEYYLFSQLLQKAGLVASGSMPSLVSEGNRLVAFVPTNDAIRDNLKSILGCASLKIADNGTLSGTVSASNKTILANYLRNYFISSLMNTITTYPYQGSAFQGRFLAMSGEYVEVVSDAGISISLQGGKPVSVSQKFLALPFAFSDGCIQFIEGILEVKK